MLPHFAGHVQLVPLLAGDVLESAFLVHVPGADVRGVDRLTILAGELSRQAAERGGWHGEIHGVAPMAVAEQVSYHFRLPAG